MEKRTGVLAYLGPANAMLESMPLKSFCGPLYMIGAVIRGSIWASSMYLAYIGVMGRGRAVALACLEFFRSGAGAATGGHGDFHALIGAGEHDGELAAHGMSVYADFLGIDKGDLLQEGDRTLVGEVDQVPVVVAGGVKVVVGDLIRRGVRKPVVVRLLRRIQRCPFGGDRAFGGLALLLVLHQAPAPVGRQH